MSTQTKETQKDAAPKPQPEPQRQFDDWAAI